MLDAIRKFLKRAWDFLKKIFVKIVSFSENIVNFFRSKYDAIIKKHPKVDAIALKIEAIKESGEYNTVKMSDYQIVNTFYDKETEEIIEDATEIISYESLDEETKERFADKEMIIIE